MEICKRPTYQNILTAQGAHTSKNSDNKLQHEIDQKQSYFDYQSLRCDLDCKTIYDTLSNDDAPLHQVCLQRFNSSEHII